MTVSEMFCEREKAFLSEYAFRTSDTRGREKPGPICPNRTEFQRDRDRIIHSKAFRRLMHKTQVFIFPQDEHFRTRMTHTLEVTQIARIICRALRLNEDLCEAAALGHDLGHTPFGHSGEHAMQMFYSKDFAHYKQSIRVVEKLENNGEGLNLTWEVKDAILNHTGDSEASTLEGKIIKLADRIAYINHDIDDAIRGGILSIDDIPKELLKTLGRGHGERINNMVSAVISESMDKPYIKMEKEKLEATLELRKFLFQNVYHNKTAKAEEDKAIEMLRILYEYFVKNPNEMPGIYFENTKNEPVERCVCDYIASMTDRYAIDMFRELYVPGMWKRTI
ncbi:MAG: deoxyguanosinetriphosphate triphosphohydrolase [Clostridia bacterium]|nr:deoxyguanosinetriphosphate triphosphohydrolase [Clostridia bacterium]MBQ7788208.1 deoxyguanosinetriphosphate triphosphohydrolase [Clostridia bacterium]